MMLLFKMGASMDLESLKGKNLMKSVEMRNV